MTNRNRVLTVQDNKRMETMARLLQYIYIVCKSRGKLNQIETNWHTHKTEMKNHDDVSVSFEIENCHSIKTTIKYFISIYSMGKSKKGNNKRSYHTIWNGEIEGAKKICVCSQIVNTYEGSAWMRAIEPQRNTEIK